jgi:hypothetical protein
MLPFGVTIPAAVPQGVEIHEGLMNNPVLSFRMSRSVVTVDVALLCFHVEVIVYVSVDFFRRLCIIAKC